MDRVWSVYLDNNNNNQTTNGPQLVREMPSCRRRLMLMSYVYDFPAFLLPPATAVNIAIASPCRLSRHALASTPPLFILPHSTLPRILLALSFFPTKIPAVLRALRRRRMPSIGV